MRSKRLALTLIAPLAFTTACAGRSAVPTATVQPHDTGSTCTMVSAELAANRQRINELESESTGTVVGNVALAVVGVAFFPPLLFAMDLKNAAATERRSLEQRNIFLSTLEAERCVNRAPPIADAAPRQMPALTVAATPATATPIAADPVPTAPIAAMPVASAPPASVTTLAVSALQPNTPIGQTLEQYVAGARAECRRQRQRSCDAVSEAAAREYENAWQAQAANRARTR